MSRHHIRLMHQDQPILVVAGYDRPLRELFLHSDCIVFLVGSGVNPAHHDPSLPVELEIRRTLVRRLKTLLESKHFKQVDVRYF